MIPVVSYASKVKVDDCWDEYGGLKSHTPNPRSENIQHFDVRAIDDSYRNVNKVF
jgi:hypothetical protein